MSDLFKWMTDIQIAEALPDFYLVYEGWRFTAPFLCMCCGKETTAVQWAYGRTCGSCDSGACARHKRHGRRVTKEHDLPPFFIAGSREERFAHYCQYVEAIPDNPLP